jgi:hypothetical protein
MWSLYHKVQEKDARCCKGERPAPGRASSLLLSTTSLCSVWGTFIDQCTDLSGQRAGQGQNDNMRFTCCFVQGCVAAVLEQASPWHKVHVVNLYDKFLHTPSHPDFLRVFPVGGPTKVVESSKQGHAAFVVVLNYIYIRKVFVRWSSRSVRKET